ncbi:hypothetical protein UC34_14285 [Pandoraea vervacti]|uniref:Uncharacterized protein n=1 Tax=Pandoraea vervacti TaxID=656178 RepID=A0ABN4FRN4_9BURK|nr:hypothetical protein [Pandoraea vervacti]AJP57833.1 hypothetical protein UC34_14285 [Pandoraea vervacti]
MQISASPGRSWLTPDATAPANAPPPARESSQAVLGQPHVPAAATEPHTATDAHPHTAIDTDVAGAFGASPMTIRLPRQLADKDWRARVVYGLMCLPPERWGPVSSALAFQLLDRRDACADTREQAGLRRLAGAMAREGFVVREGALPGIVYRDGRFDADTGGQARWTCVASLYNGLLYAVLESVLAPDVTDVELSMLSALPGMWADLVVDDPAFAVAAWQRQLAGNRPTFTSAAPVGLGEVAWKCLPFMAGAAGLAAGLTYYFAAGALHVSTKAAHAETSSSSTKLVKVGQLRPLWRTLGPMVGALTAATCEAAALARLCAAGPSERDALALQRAQCLSAYALLLPSLTATELRRLVTSLGPAFAEMDVFDVAALLKRRLGGMRGSTPCDIFSLIDWPGFLRKSRERRHPQLRPETPGWVSAIEAVAALTQGMDVCALASRVVHAIRLPHRLPTHPVGLAASRVPGAHCGVVNHWPDDLVLRRVKHERQAVVSTQWRTGVAMASEANAWTVSALRYQPNHRRPAPNRIDSPGFAQSPAEGAHALSPTLAPTFVPTPGHRSLTLDQMLGVIDSTQWDESPATAMENYRNEVRASISKDMGVVLRKRYPREGFGHGAVLPWNATVEVTYREYGRSADPDRFGFTAGMSTTRTFSVLDVALGHHYLPESGFYFARREVSSVQVVDDAAKKLLSAVNDDTFRHALIEHDREQLAAMETSVALRTAFESYVQDMFVGLLMNATTAAWERQLPPGSRVSKVGRSGRPWHQLGGPHQRFWVGYDAVWVMSFDEEVLPGLLAASSPDGKSVLLMSIRHGTTFGWQPGMEMSDALRAFLHAHLSTKQKLKASSPLRHDAFKFRIEAPPVISNRACVAAGERGVSGEGGGRVAPDGEASTPAKGLGVLYDAVSFAPSFRFVNCPSPKRELWFAKLRRAAQERDLLIVTSAWRAQQRASDLRHMVHHRLTLVSPATTAAFRGLGRAGIALSIAFELGSRISYASGSSTNAPTTRADVDELERIQYDISLSRSLAALLRIPNVRTLDALADWLIQHSAQTASVVQIWDAFMAAWPPVAQRRRDFANQIRLMVQGEQEVGATTNDGARNRAAKGRQRKPMASPTDPMHDTSAGALPHSLRSIGVIKRSWNLMTDGQTTVPVGDGERHVDRYLGAARLQVTSARQAKRLPEGYGFAFAESDGTMFFAGITGGHGELLGIRVDDTPATARNSTSFPTAAIERFDMRGMTFSDGRFQWGSVTGTMYVEALSDRMPEARRLMSHAVGDLAESTPTAAPEASSSAASASRMPHGPLTPVMPVTPAIRTTPASAARTSPTHRAPVRTTTKPPAPRRMYVPPAPHAKQDGAERHAPPTPPGSSGHFKAPPPHAPYLPPSTTVLPTPPSTRAPHLPPPPHAPNLLPTPPKSYVPMTDHASHVPPAPHAPPSMKRGKPEVVIPTSAVPMVSPRGRHPIPIARGKRAHDAWETFVDLWNAREGRIAVDVDTQALSLNVTARAHPCAAPPTMASRLSLASSATASPMARGGVGGATISAATLAELWNAPDFRAALTEDVVRVHRGLLLWHVAHMPPPQRDLMLGALTGRDAFRSVLVNGTRLPGIVGLRDGTCGVLLSVTHGQAVALPTGAGERGDADEANARVHAFVARHARDPDVRGGSGASVTLEETPRGDPIARVIDDLRDLLIHAIQHGGALDAGVAALACRAATATATATANASALIEAITGVPTTGTPLSPDVMYLNDPVDAARTAPSLSLARDIGTAIREFSADIFTTTPTDTGAHDSAAQDVVAFVAGFVEQVNRCRVIARVHDDIANLVEFGMGNADFAGAMLGAGMGLQDGKFGAAISAVWRHLPGDRWFNPRQRGAPQLLALRGVDGVRNVPRGYRVFVDADSESAPESKGYDDMLSLGNGRFAVASHVGTLSEPRFALTAADLTQGGAGIVGSGNDTVWHRDGAVVRLWVQSDAPGLFAEPSAPMLQNGTIDASVFADRLLAHPNVAALRSRQTGTARWGLDSALQRLLATAAEMLGNHGATEVKYRLIVAWSAPDQFRPRVSFAMVGEAPAAWIRAGNVSRVVVDLFPRQALGDAVTLTRDVCIASEHDWQNIYRGYADGRCVKYFDFSTANDAQLAAQDFIVAPGGLAGDFRPNGVLLCSPAWRSAR